MPSASGVKAASSKRLSDEMAPRRYATRRAHDREQKRQRVKVHLPVPVPEERCHVVSTWACTDSVAAWVGGRLLRLSCVCSATLSVVGGHSAGPLVAPAHCRLWSRGVNNPLAGTTPHAAERSHAIRGNVQRRPGTPPLYRPRHTVALILTDGDVCDSTRWPINLVRHHTWRGV